MCQRKREFPTLVAEWKPSVLKVDLHLVLRDIGNRRRHIFTNDQPVLYMWRWERGKIGTTDRS